MEESNDVPSNKSAPATDELGLIEGVPDAVRDGLTDGVGL